MTLKEPKHGTHSAYANGCRCQPCTYAGSVRRTQGTLEEFLAGTTRTAPLFHPEDRTTPYDEDDPRHGQLSAYTQGCRCPWCREAGRAYRNHRKLGIPLPKSYNARHIETQGVTNA